MLPTRDLALYVQETFEAIAKRRGLKLAVVTTLQSRMRVLESVSLSRHTRVIFLPGGRKNILDEFKRQEIDILVFSDIPHVAHVVSYDAPIDIRKYVHRAGRTARAGRVGDAWTLVEEQEAKFFKDMLRDAGEGRLERVARMRVKDGELEGMETAYDTALQNLKEVYSRSATLMSRR